MKRGGGGNGRSLGVRLHYKVKGLWKTSKDSEVFCFVSIPLLVCLFGFVFLLVMHMLITSGHSLSHCYLVRTVITFKFIC